jgi:hypothetical protein
VCLVTGDQTDQDSRSTGVGAATSVSAMDVTIYPAFLPHTDPDAALATPDLDETFAGNLLRINEVR